jgi:protein tyrosine/serine phosphatase
VCSPRMMNISRAAQRLGILLAFSVLTLASLIGWSIWNSNYHTVFPGELYRSGQLSAQQLKQHIQQDGLRSILNLRGADPGKPWYETEQTLARQYRVKHVDFALSASKVLEPQQLSALVTLLRELPKPMLIHCLGGADRTSLASAIYLYAVKGEPASQAAEQLSIQYGHFPYLFRSEVAAMDESFQRYVSGSQPSNTP